MFTTTEVRGCIMRWERGPLVEWLIQADTRIRRVEYDHYLLLDVFLKLYVTKARHKSLPAAKGMTKNLEDNGTSDNKRSCEEPRHRDIPSAVSLFFSLGELDVDNFVHINSRGSFRWPAIVELKAWKDAVALIGPFVRN